jgi:hypothetical protein
VQQAEGPGWLVALASDLGEKAFTSGHATQ